MIDQGMSDKDLQISEPSSSLALDQDGITHISYKKVFDLMYNYSISAYQVTYLTLVMK